MNNSTTEERGGTGDTGETRRIASNLAGVVHDITELAELQVKLFLTDTKAVLRESIPPLVLIVIAICTLLGAVPIVLMGLAEVLVVQTELSRIGSLFVAAGVGVGVALVGLAVAAWRLRKGCQQLGGSLDELERNVAWVKQVLKKEGPRTRG